MKFLSLILAVALIAGFTAPAWSAQEGAKGILKSGIVGAGVGAVAAGASGGKAGKGALIGAGAGIAGDAIMGALTEEPAPKQQVQQVEAAPAAPSAYQQGYDTGYAKGFDAGYEKGYSSGMAAKR